MTAPEFRATLKILGLRQLWLADVLGVDANTTSRWATGKLPVPQHAAAYLRLLCLLGKSGKELMALAADPKACAEILVPPLSVADRTAAPSRRPQ